MLRGQMKIRQVVRRMAWNVIWRPDEQIGLAGEGPDFAAGGGRFQRPGHRRADGNDPPAGLLALPQSFGDFRRERAPFAVHRVLIEPLRRNRPKRAHADVQRHPLLVPCRGASARRAAPA